MEVQNGQYRANLIKGSVTTMNKDLMKRLYYFSMFDGSLQKRFKNGEARLSVSMTDDHADYIKKLEETLLELDIGFSIGIQDRRHENPNRKVMMRLQSKSHPIFTRIWNRMYIDNRKVVDPHMLTMLDAEALAIAYMADGGVYFASNTAIAQHCLHTNGLSYGDNMLLKLALKKTFDLEFNIDKKNKYFQLRLRRGDSQRFFEIVDEFILPSFRYKLERQAPEKGGDIVCSVQECTEIGRNDQSRIDPKSIRINK